MSAADYLTGQLLIAMPAMGDPRFSKSVIYMCVHNEEGAMGLIVNKLADGLGFADLLDQICRKAYLLEFSIIRNDTATSSSEIKDPTSQYTELLIPQGTFQFRILLG